MQQIAEHIHCRLFEKVDKSVSYTQTLLIECPFSGKSLMLSLQNKEGTLMNLFALKTISS